MKRVLNAALALVLSGGAAMACAPDPASVRDWAFGKLSPVAVSDAPGDKTTERSVPIAFGVAYPVLERRGFSDLKICINGAEAWTSRVNFADIPRRAWIQTTSAMRNKDRPRLQFWKDENDLRPYVGGQTEDHKPDYQEVTGNAVLRTLRLPMLRDSVVRMSGGARDVAIANVLLPFPRTAVERYAKVRDPGNGVAAEAMIMGLVVDVSGSTRGFVEPPLAALIAALQANEGTKGAQIVTAAFGGTGKVEGKPSRPITDGALLTWPVQAAPVGTPGTHDVAAAIQYVASTLPAPAPLLVLAGGDVGLERAVLDAFSSVTVAKITPELQGRLERSAGRGSTVFHAFGPDQGTALAETLIAAAPKTPGLETDENAFKEVADLMRAARMLPVLPADIKGQAEMADAPVGADTAEWFALPLWMVIRLDLLSYHDE